MKRLYYLIMLAILPMFTGCNDDKKTTKPEIITVNTAPETKVHIAETGDAEFKDAKVAKVFSHYINLKTALVNTNSKVSASAANRMLTALEGLEAVNSLEVALTEIAENSSIEAQRTSFVLVTETMESMLDGALNSGTIFKQYCPMAFGNTGGYWLSNSKDIMNPYFGDKMLKCGRVDSEIK